MHRDSDHAAKPMTNRTPAAYPGTAVLASICVSRRYGCSGRTPTHARCSGDHDQPMTVTTMPAPYGESVRVAFPAGAVHKWWSVGIGNETSDGGVTLDFFRPDGTPYATPSCLHGTSAAGCAALVWANTNTSWYKNGSTSWCTAGGTQPMAVSLTGDQRASSGLCTCDDDGCPRSCDDPRGRAWR